MDTTFNAFYETEVPTNELIISRTNLQGIITYANETFATISGYTVDELIGQPHNILRHPDMPASVFKTLWKDIKNEKAWEGYVKNLRKDGGFYWVHARISGVYQDGKLVEYKSLRSVVPKEKRRQMQELYDEQREAEGGKVRITTYLPASTYQQLLDKAEETNQTPEALLQTLL